MFDISFTEMLIVAVVALVVIGPERLPKVARQAGQWITKLRRYVDDVKSDFNRQIELSELRSLKKDVEDAAKSIEGSVTGAVSDVRSSFDSVNQALQEPGGSSTAATEPATDWDKIYAIRRTRERIKDRRIERERERGFKRPPRRPTFR
ncbi:MAG: Sec-independent protein translocase protein TatB [Lautropia sp.]